MSAGRTRSEIAFHLDPTAFVTVNRKQTMTGRIAVLSALVAAVIGVAIEIRLVTRQRDRLTFEKHRFAQLETRVATARTQRDETLVAQRAAVEQLSSLQKSADEKEARRAPV